MAEKLTDRTIFSGTVDKDNDLIHIVDVSDTSQDPAGSSFSCVPKKFINSYISSGSETEGQTLYFDATTGKFLNTSNVHIDDSNNFVGVGITSALTAKLHVKSASGTAFQVDGSSLASIFKVQNDGTSLFQNFEIKESGIFKLWRFLDGGLLRITDSTGVNNNFQLANDGRVFINNNNDLSQTNARLYVQGNSTGNSNFDTIATFYKSSSNLNGVWIKATNTIGVIQAISQDNSVNQDLYLSSTNTGARVDNIKLLGSGYNLNKINTSALADGSHANSEMSFWVDESGNTLNFKVKYSSGTVKSGSIALV
jgi:hypothetical protein